MKKILALLILCSSLLAYATTTLEVNKDTWKMLSKVALKKQYDEMMGFDVDVPVFDKELQALEGTTVEVTGYIIPTEGYKSHQEFVFSKYPYNMCYFCGGAGPETVMEVFTTKPVKYTADIVTLKGKLALNSQDPNRMFYFLLEAKRVK